MRGFGFGLWACVLAVLLPAPVLAAGADAPSSPGKPMPAPGLPATKLFGVPAGCNGVVNAAVRAPDGRVYFGGTFSLCEDVPAAGVVAYDPTTRRFAPLGVGAGNGVDGSVRALALAEGNLYVGGGFTRAGGQPAANLARWNGSGWSGVGNGVGTGATNDSVNAIAVSGEVVYVGGRFGAAGTLAARNLARWNGQAWSRLGDADVNGEVSALALDGNRLYIGGDYDRVGTLAASNIAVWDGSAWAALGAGVGTAVRGYVEAIAVASGSVYVGGQFEQAGAVAANNVARWTGSAWVALGPASANGVDGIVQALAVSDGGLYAGGLFGVAGGRAARNLGYWNGSAWSALGSPPDGVNGGVYALAAAAGELHVGGDFSRAGDTEVRALARWDGARWNQLGLSANQGVAGTVAALLYSGERLFVAGSFDRVGALAANNIAMWNGTSWARLGDGAANGVNGPVSALAMFAGDLYAGGNFTQAGGRPASSIARWDGSAWRALGSESAQGVAGVVLALATHADALHVGGIFSGAAGVPANRVARWNGSAWSALGAGIPSGAVNALASAGADLVVGGGFAQAGTVAARNVARWTGSEWQPYGAGVGDGVSAVYALASVGSSVYAGGDFLVAGGSAARRIARWDGSRWQPLGAPGSDGVDGAATGEVPFVFAMATAGNDVYVGGSFTSAGGAAANSLARWDGSAWHGLATKDPPQRVLDLASNGVNLAVNGIGLTQSPLAVLQSAATNGGQANGGSRGVVVTRTGLRIGFVSDASNLTPGDANGRSDVFVRDPVSGATTRASLAAESINGGTQESFDDVALSVDGSRVAFSGSSGQVYAVIDGTARVVSRSTTGAPGNGPSGKAELPGAGTQAIFESQASNLIAADANGSVADIFATDLASGEVTLVSRAPDGAPADGPSFAPHASDDGDTIVFSTLATNIVSTPAPSAPGAKAGTILQATVMRASGRSRFYVSRNLTTGQTGNGDSKNVRITPDGRWGVFESVASNLVAGDSNGFSDIFRFEIRNDAMVRLERVSVSRLGTEGNGHSKNATLSDDGEYITFETEATNLVELDSNTAVDVVVKWLVSGEVLRLPQTVDGAPPNSGSAQPTIAGNGSIVVFASGASNLAPNDANAAPDVFSVALRERGPTLISGPLDEPNLVQFALPAPNPANANCPAGFFAALVDDGPGAGLTAGAFGVEVLLDEPGTRVLAGGINFGGLIDAGQVGFAGFNIRNANNEPQRVNVSLRGSPASASTAGMPVRVRIARRTATTSETVFEATPTISLATPYLASIEVPPAFYEVNVAPLSGTAGGDAEGQFFFELTTSFVNRPGGGFDGGAVVGGYHARHPFGGVSGFAAFCLATPHSTSIRVLSQPSYGPAGARDLRLRIQDAQQRDIVAVPGG